MSLKSQALATCQKCGGQHNVAIYKSINTALDPDLKAAVLDGSLFLWECSHCGAQNLMAYECLYHDPDQKFMIWMLPQGMPEGPQTDAIMNQVRAMGDYRLRSVKNAGELMEKVLVFDAGLDDRCIELVKYVASREEGMDGVSNLHFYRMQDDVMVFSGVKGGQMQGFGFGLSVYQDCEGILARNPSLSEEAGFEIIDNEWVDGILA